MRAAARTVEGPIAVRIESRLFDEWFEISGRRGRFVGDADGAGEEFGKEPLEPPPALRRELGPDRRQGARRWGRGGTWVGS